MMTATDYSDTTPDITMEYDALGRPATQSTPVAKTAFTYTPATLALVTETISYNLDGAAGYEFTRVLDRSQDTLGRDSGYSLGSTPAPGVGGGASPPPELVTSYAYNPTDGRLSTVGRGDIPVPQSFNYTYLANSNLIETITGLSLRYQGVLRIARAVVGFSELLLGLSQLALRDNVATILQHLEDSLAHTVHRCDLVKVHVCLLLFNQKL
jgi:hypothetical protein